MINKKSRVFITGDTHCPIDIHKFNSKNFSIGKTLTKDDIVIICGDGGFVWNGDKSDKYWINWLSRKPWTTVYVDGNHENFDLLNKYPVVDFKGAKAHKISDSLYHILRGEIMTINDQTYFCFGGAFSHDRQYRIENISWWQQELPVQQEVDNAIDNLNKVNNQVDYIISHDVPTGINNILGYNTPNISHYDTQYIHICHFLQNIYDTTQYKVWFAGHYHINKRILNLQILYNDMVEVSEQEPYYHLIDTEYNNTLARTFTREELKQIGIKEKLFISQSRIDTYESFGVNDYIISLEDFFNTEVTDNELNIVTHMYNVYTIKKNTYIE